MRKKSPLFSAMIISSLLVGGILSSCDANVEPIDEVEGTDVPVIEVTTYNIAFTETNGVEAALSKTIAEAGEEIEITIESIPEGYEIESITADVKSVDIITESSTLYTFIMPESDVNLTIDVVEIIDEPTEYSLTITNNVPLEESRLIVVNAEDNTEVYSDNYWIDDPYYPTVMNKTRDNLIAGDEYYVLIDGDEEFWSLYSVVASVTKGETTLNALGIGYWSFVMPNEDVEIALTWTEIVLEEYSLTIYSDQGLEYDVLCLINPEDNTKTYADSWLFDNPYDPNLMTTKWDNLIAGQEYIIYIDLDDEYWDILSVTASVTVGDTTLELRDTGTWLFTMPYEDVEIELNWTEIVPEVYSLIIYNDVPLEGNILYLLDAETNAEIEGDFEYDDPEYATSMTKTWQDLEAGTEYIIYIDGEEFWDEYEVTGSVTTENATLELISTGKWKFVMPNGNVEVTLSWASLE